MWNKKILIKSLSLFLIISILATVGFLSFTGMLLITPSIAIACASFFFAVVIEGEVYKQNILAGFKQLFTRNYLKKKIIDRELSKLVKNQTKTEQSAFLRDYKSQLQYIKELKANHVDKDVIKEEKKRLKLMRRFFRKYIFSKKKYKGNALIEELEQVYSHEEKNLLNNELVKKRWLNKVMITFYFLAGTSCTFASIYSIHAGCLTLMATWGISLAPTLLLGGIIPIGILAGLGYALLMYKNTTDMIANDTIQKTLNKFKSFFLYQSDQSKIFFSLKIAALAITAIFVIGCCIFATIATAGTWWLAVKQGARLVPYLAKLANWIRNITIPAMIIPTFLFNLKNSLSTLKKLEHFSITRRLKETFNEIQQTRASENIIQFLNPFRLLIKTVELPVQFFTFVFHLMSMCVMGDKLEGIPPIMTSTGNLANETLVDAHYFMEDGHHHHDHHHGTIINKLLFIVLSPLHGLSELWNWGFSNNEKINFTGLIKDRFGMQHKTNLTSLPQTPELSNAWKYQEILLKLGKDKEQNKLPDNVLLPRVGFLKNWISTDSTRDCSTYLAKEDSYYRVFKHSQYQSQADDLRVEDLLPKYSSRRPKW